jgi:hypothetical protein
VEVLHDRGAATRLGLDRWTSGSGYLVGRRLVLTAAHNVDYRRDFGHDEQLLVRTLEGDVLAVRVVLVVTRRLRLIWRCWKSATPNSGSS